MEKFCSDLHKSDSQSGRHCSINQDCLFYNIYTFFLVISLMCTSANVLKKTCLTVQSTYILKSKEHQRGETKQYFDGIDQHLDMSSTVKDIRNLIKYQKTYDTINNIGDQSDQCYFSTFRSALVSKP